MGQLGCLPGYAPYQLLHTCSIDEYGTGESPWFLSNNWKHQCHQHSSCTKPKTQQLLKGKLTLSQSNQDTQEALKTERMQSVQRPEPSQENKLLCSTPRTDVHRDNGTGLSYRKFTSQMSGIIPGPLLWNLHLVWILLPLARSSERITSSEVYPFFPTTLREVFPLHTDFGFSRILRPSYNYTTGKC